MKENSRKVFHPWGQEEETETSATRSPVLDFEDSFIGVQSCNSSSSSIDDKKYVPLDDSKEYLEGLEKKLARIQGKTKSCRESERKQLITALALSREDHTSHFINSDNTSCDVGACEDEANPSATSLNSVNPQGTLGAMIRKVAPDKVALSAEELCELLKGDILAKFHDSLISEEPNVEEGERTSTSSFSLQGTKDDAENLNSSASEEKQTKR